MFQFTWPLCTPPMFKFGPRGFQNWFYIHCSSNQKKVPSAQTFFAPNRSKLGKWTIQNHCERRPVAVAQPWCLGRCPYRRCQRRPVAVTQLWRGLEEGETSKKEKCPHGGCSACTDSRWTLVSYLYPWRILPGTQNSHEEHRNSSTDFQAVRRHGYPAGQLSYTVRYITVLK